MAKTFGSADAYYRALRALDNEGIHRAHRDLLRAHFAAPDHTVSWRELAPSVGYPHAEPVKLQYGRFARRIAEQLGVSKRQAGGFWLHVLADFGPRPDSKGHTTYRLRTPAIAALKRLGWVDGVAPPSLLDTDDGIEEGRPELRWVAHRHREAVLRRRKIAQALSESPDGKLRCAVAGCRFCFEDVYGAKAHAYIQVHHLQPLSSRAGASKTSLKDLMLVCANCHAMIHYLGAGRSLRRLVQRAREA